jgi:hypothetical protein
MQSINRVLQYELLSEVGASDNLSLMMYHTDRVLDTVKGACISVYQHKSI